MAYVIAAPSVPALPVSGSADLFPVNRIFCVGRNYADHVREMGGDPKNTPTVFFMKPSTAILPEGADFPFPGLSKNVHYEFELVVAIGKGGSDISTAAAKNHVYGYAVGLDMTRRDLQVDAGKKGQPWEVGKSFDHSAPCSKIVPAKMSGHPEKGAIWLELNGKRVQDSDISQLIWNVPGIIASLSSYFELLPGYLIYTGTPSCVGPVQKGDVMHGRVAGVGELTVRVI